MGALPAAALGGDPPDPAELPLPPLRSDLHIQRVGSFRDGSPRFRIHDPLRNRYFELGLLDVELLTHWRAGESPRELAARLEQEGAAAVEAGEVVALHGLLMRHQLVAADDGGSYMLLRDLWRRSRVHWLTWLLHHYLFFRVPLVRPDAWLERRLPLVRRLVAAPVLALLVVLALVTPVLLAREWTAWTESLAGLLTFDGIVASAAAAFLAKILHELGHAFVARHHGVRVPVMGVAFLVMFPMLYTDTSDSWKLHDHRARFRIAAAGMATELALALVALFLWTVTPPGGLRSALFFLSTTSLLLTLSINASPFMRFDGYFLLSDALDFPNLHERSGAMARWWMRRTLFGLQVPPPEPHPRAMARFLVVFAYVTWAYRLVVFLGIALLVYYAFFKLLGIVLMLVELGWFIARPVVSEARELWKIRSELRPRKWRLGALLLAVLGGFTLWAWAAESRSSGLYMAAEESRLFAPAPARIAQVAVRPGQRVGAGELLLQLEAPDLAFRAQSTQVRIERTQGELARIPASERQRERSQVLQEELAQALSELQAIQEESALLAQRAGHAGRVVDMPPDLRSGRWVHPKQLLGRVVASERGQVRAWVTESQVRRLALGQLVHFTPRLPEQPRIGGRIVRIDTTGSRLLPHALLAGQHGGDLVTSQNARGEWEMRQALYQVDVETDSPAPGRLLAGHLHVPTGPGEAVVASLRQFLTVLVRESGF
ncbi:HlyD family efflux transporter periplasmic adaptor subunit [Ramlibacter tataouinensis]|uniref:efflux RND transporter periplasmic adaptor subunit n=1 Tax=Ramlibacter tataouinensis TaxID=94132 RepID=UPI0022F3FA5F|nr:HlyD family efflux transporter periplasmic adaptor subunit [Ramlibacter tataouinensis]WBY03779.1 HlyD family efflux transporter periplasmic adaptor subunit [Ramlibacter tataouinensis]